MTIEELIGLVPEDKREEAKAMIASEVAKANPIAGLDETNAEAMLERTPLLKGARDRFFQRGLETWQKNNIDKIYNERYAKENPEETPAEKRIKALEIANKETERRAIRAENRGLAQTLLTERKLPMDLLDFVIGDDADATKAAVERLTGGIEQYGTALVEAKANEILKQYNRTPGDPGTNGGGEKYLQTEDQIAAESQKPNADWNLINRSYAALQKQQT